MFPSRNQLLQVGGSLVEATVSAVASVAVAVLANKYLDCCKFDTLKRASRPCGGPAL